MSGGHFDFDVNLSGLSRVADEIMRFVKENDTPDGHNFSEETLEKFREAALLCRQAGVAIHRVDYLVSGDDGEKTFHGRWAEEMSKIRCCMDLPDDFLEREGFLDEQITRYINNGGKAVIFPSDETGDVLWVVAKEEEQEFWLNGFPTREEAVSWCEEVQVNLVNPAITQAEVKEHVRILERRGVDEEE